MRILHRSVITSEDPFCSVRHQEHKAETCSVTIHQDSSDGGDILVRWHVAWEVQKIFTLNAANPKP